MKKIVWVVALVALVLLVAPFGIGKLAEKRIDDGLDQLVLRAPYLSISERKYHGGWFSSEEDVTFELPGGAPKFTVHNVIHHGPVLGASLGLARVESHFVLDPKTRAELTKSFGSEEPYQITTYYGFFGGGTLLLSANAGKSRTGSGDDLSWDALKVVLDFSQRGDSFTLDGQWPAFQGHNDARGSHFLMHGLTLKATGKRLLGEVFDTDGEFSLAEVDSTETNKPQFAWKDIHYTFNTEPHGDFVDLDLKLGSGPMQSDKFNVKEMHYDFGLHRLHAETLDKVLTGMRQSYKSVLKSGPGAEAAVLARYKQDAVELLKYDPEFALDRVNLVMDDGDGTLKGLIKFQGVTAQDLDAGAPGLLPKLAADFDLNVAEALVTKLTGNSGAIEKSIAEGMLLRKEGRLLCTLSFHGGKFLVNGKEQPIPGLGGPRPAGATAE